jgi:hypothetical protein
MARPSAHENFTMREQPQHDRRVEMAVRQQPQRDRLFDNFCRVQALLEGFRSAADRCDPEDLGRFAKQIPEALAAAQDSVTDLSVRVLKAVK